MKQRHPPQTVHKALGLPAPYQVAVKVEGHIRYSMTRIEHMSLRILRSPTLGTVAVFAKSLSWGPWVEIRESEFTELADQIIGRKFNAVILNPT